MENILALLCTAFLLWILYRGIKNNRSAFSKENLNKSFMTMGLLALVLIAGIGFAVLALR